MPLIAFQKSKCVLYALVICVVSLTVADAQEYSQSRSIGRPEFTSIVDSLAGDAPQHESRRYESSRQPLRPVNGPALRSVEQGTVALRPQPLSVQPSSFQSAKPLSQDSRDTVRPNGLDKLGRMNAEAHLQSFIERENESGKTTSKADATEMISKIGINLLFVLALAIGGILLVKHLQKGKLNQTTAESETLAGLKIDQILQVTRGVSLYLVDGMNSKVLVAVDSGGIKSVNVLPGRFEDGLDDPSAFSAAKREEPARTEKAEPRRRRSSSGVDAKLPSSIDTTSSSEIDDNLIRMLLANSKKAA